MAGLFWKSIVMASTQPTLGMAALWRWMMRKTLRLSSMSCV